MGWEKGGPERVPFLCRPSMTACAYAHAEKAVEDTRRMTLRADLLGGGLSLGIVGRLSVVALARIVGETLRRIVGELLAIEAAHVASGAGGHKHLPGGELLRIGIEILRCAANSTP